MSQLSSVCEHHASFVAQIERLTQEIGKLQQENQDLNIALATIAEHGDMVEALLHDTNVKLKVEIAERRRAEAKLQALLHLIGQQKSDLEIIVETIMQHGDVLDIQWRQKLYETTELANLDGLTQVPNRRRFDSYLATQWKLRLQEQNPVSIILCDIDYFKQYNDHYGHLRGDDCLRRVAHALSATLRNSEDLFARYGGEEFVAVLPQTDETGTLRAAERMQAAIALLQIPHKGSSVSPFITISIGVACTIPSGDHCPETLLEQADQHLYQAKQQGRNRIVHCSPVPLKE